MLEHITFKEWTTQAAMEHFREATMGPDLNLPFPGDLWEKRYVIGKGKECVVYGFPSDTEWAGYVIKEARKKMPFHYAFAARLQFGKDSSIYLSWRDTAVVKADDFKNLQPIFGNYLVPTVFVHSADGTRPTNYTLQPRLEGKTLTGYTKKEQSALFQDSALRGQILDILWGSKKTFLKFDAPADVDDKNILLSPDKKIYLIEAGNPSIVAAIIRDNQGSPSLRFLHYRLVTKKLRYLQDLSRLVNPTVEEELKLDQKYQLNSSVFADKTRVA